MKIPTYEFEKELWAQGVEFVVGVDEVGRGAWAGPLVAAAVILPKNKKLKLLRDSKTISEKQREKLTKKIKKEAVAYAYGIVEAKEINEFRNIYKTNTLAITRALENLKKSFLCFQKSKVFKIHVLLDGRRIKNFPFEYTAIEKGDSRSVSIAAASILAKVERDRIMKEFEKEFSQYRFGKHKGYGTRLHQKLLEQFGPSPVHRLHFKPLNPKLF